MLPTSRKEAKRIGAVKYYTGKPCKNGHDSPKFTSQGSCVECELHRTRQWREVPENKEKVRVNNRARDPKVRAAYNRERVAKKKERTPSWADHDAIKFFEECRPAGCHTDHEIPLLGKFVSGLHVAENLQWVPDLVNMQKRNDFEPIAQSLGRVG